MPPEAPLLFEVTLLEVRDGPDSQPLPPAARLCLGSQRRERGNFHFARGDFAAALHSYRLALRALDGPTAGETGRGRRGGGGRGLSRGAEAALPPQPRPGRRRKRSCGSNASSASTTARLLS